MHWGCYKLESSCDLAGAAECRDCTTARPCSWSTSRPASSSSRIFIRGKLCSQTFRHVQTGEMGLEQLHHTSFQPFRTWRHPTYRPEAGSRFRFQGKLCPVPRFQRCQTCQFLVPALGHPLANMSHAGSDSKFFTKCMITL